jgi:DHA2 family methylenomycin A resistance protein-like MFS transporter
VDLPGQAAAIVTLTALAAATVAGGQRGFAEPFVLGGFGLAAAGVAFVLIEHTRAQPMLPLSLFASRTLLGTAEASTLPSSAAAAPMGRRLPIAW